MAAFLLRQPVMLFANLCGAILFVRLLRRFAYCKIISFEPEQFRRQLGHSLKR